MTPVFTHQRAVLYAGDCLEWLRGRPANSLHACVTDPPYGLVEYSAEQQQKMRAGKGGVWRIPPSFDGAKRQPLPRFTTLTSKDLQVMSEFFEHWAMLLFPALVPGAHVIIASNPLVSQTVARAVSRPGFERRGEIIRLVSTFRGGDRPKNAHEEFPDVSVLPRSMYEPWLVFRKPLQGRVQDNLRLWKTGGFRRISKDQPFSDVIRSRTTPPEEKEIAPHPSLKPQAFLRQIVRAVLPLGEGVIFDSFAGSGSTLAAAVAVKYEAVGVEIDREYVELAKLAIPTLAALGIADSGDASDGDRLAVSDDDPLPLIHRTAT